jgi:hypothetical protein
MAAELGTQRIRKEKTRLVVVVLQVTRMICPAGARSVSTSFTKGLISLACVCSCLFLTCKCLPVSLCFAHAYVKCIANCILIGNVEPAGWPTAQLPIQQVKPVPAVEQGPSANRTFSRRPDMRGFMQRRVQREPVQSLHAVPQAAAGQQQVRCSAVYLMMQC